MHFVNCNMGKSLSVSDFAFFVILSYLKIEMPWKET